jgi:hypothetical protein
MGVILSGPRSKVAYYKDQAYKARRDALAARQAGNDSEEERLKDVAARADQAALDTQQQARESAE